MQNFIQHEFKEVKSWKAAHGKVMFRVIIEKYQVQIHHKKNTEINQMKYGVLLLQEKEVYVYNMLFLANFFIISFKMIISGSEFPVGSTWYVHWIVCWVA